LDEFLAKEAIILVMVSFISSFLTSSLRISLMSFMPPLAIISFAPASSLAKTIKLFKAFCYKKIINQHFRFFQINMILQFVYFPLFLF